MTEKFITPGSTETLARMTSGKMAAEILGELATFCNVTTRSICGNEFLFCRNETGDLDIWKSGKYYDTIADCELAMVIESEVLYGVR